MGQIVKKLQFVVDEEGHLGACQALLPALGNGADLAKNSCLASFYGLKCHARRFSQWIKLFYKTTGRVSSFKQ